MIRIIIVDDQIILRESLKFIVEQDSEINVVALGGNGKEALALCDKHHPDVVLMDIMMPDCNGVEGTKLIKAKYNSIKVIILTTFNDEENISQALKNGADGYVLKDIKPDELIMAVKSSVKGLNVMHPSAFNTVANKMSPETVSTKTPNDKRANIELTERELDVVRLIVDGKSNKEIASSLFITEGSVKNIITIILDKLKLKDRTQLAVFAVKNNII
jgi:DNA-binding NarL/FixJ family response regulator